MAAPVKAWSKSSLNTLLDGCSWQWALEKVYKLPSTGSLFTALGTAYHSAVELHERVRIVRVRDGVDIPLPSASAMFEHALTVLHAECDQLPPQQWELHDVGSRHELARLLEVAIYHWHETEVPGLGESLRDRIMRWRPVAVEPYFNVDTGTGRVHGFIDWLGYDHDAGEWVVIDHKTAGGFSRWSHDGAGHEMEASVYVVGSEIAKHLPVAGPIRQEWHVARRSTGSTVRFEGARVATMRVDEGHRLFLADQLQSADRKVETDDFWPNPSWNLCSAKWCAHFEGCQVSGVLAPGGRSLPVVASVK